MPERLKLKEMHPSMRGAFAFELYNHMLENDKLHLVVGDLGYGMFDKIRNDFPKRFWNLGASEQSMIGASMGMVESGLCVVTYSITPFLLYRPFELIRNYIDHESIPVKLVGSGRDRDYLHDGWSHWAEEDETIMHEVFHNIVARWPNTKEEIPDVVEEMLRTPKPFYVNLVR